MIKQEYKYWTITIEDCRGIQVHNIKGYLKATQNTLDISGRDILSKSNV